MPERDDAPRAGNGEARASGRRPRKACCLVSEMLEEAGLDRRKARVLKRQVLEGLILLCRWQLERMGPDDDPPPSTRRGPRKVPVQ
jgi:hypothetical protein